MKSKYNDVEEALREIKDLNNQHIGFYERLIVEYTFRQNDRRIAFSSPKKRYMAEEFNPTFGKEYRMSRMKEQKSNQDWPFRSKRKMPESVRVFVQIYFMGKYLKNECAIMSYSVLQKIAGIMDLFPHDFGCVYGDEKGFFLYQLGSPVLGIFEKQLIFRFLPEHCVTKAKEKVIVLAKKLAATEKNKNKLDFFSIKIAS